MPETQVEPMVALRRHAAEAPWSVAELADLADRLLAAGAATSGRPTTERTVRFYVSRGVVRPPFGRGAGSSWGFPHLVELLAARLAQREGDTLDQVVARRATLDDAALTAFTAEHLGTAPPPAESSDGPAAVVPSVTTWRHYPVAAGVELLLAADHPLVGDSRRLGAILDGLAREAGPPAPES